MKTLLTLLAAAGLVAGAALAAPLTEKEQTAIKQEVTQTVQNLFGAFERADIEGILGFFSDDPAFLAADAEGKVSDNPTFRKATREFFQTVSGEKIQTKSQDIKILNTGTVIVAWQGGYQTMMKDGTVVKCDSYAATFVFKRIGQGWKIIYDHESGPPPQPVPPAVAAGAPQPVSPAPTAAPEMRKLDVWYGEWTYAGEYHATPLGEAAKFTGTMSGRPSLNGNVAEFLNREQGPAGETQALELCWFDSAAKKFAYVYLGNDGYIEQGPFTMTADLCVWEGTGVAGGTAFRIKGTETVSPDQRMLTRKTEISLDGKTWLPFFDSKFTKIAAPTIEQELIKLEEDWAKAYVARDVKAMGRIEADDWVYTDADGNVITRAEDLADLASGAFVATSFVVDDLKVRVYGDTAVVTGRQTEKATYKGKDASAVYRITDTWIRRAGGWQCIASHLTKIAEK